MKYDLSNAIQYHYGMFPPQTLDYEQFMPELLLATDAIARYDQMLRYQAKCSDDGDRKNINEILSVFSVTRSR